MNHIEQFVQHNELKLAIPIDNPRNVPLENLHYWWEIVNDICKQGPFEAVAFNQLPPELLSNLGFGVPPAIIYFHNSYGSTDLHHQLWLNPRIVAESEKQRGNYESCASVVFNNKRPRVEIIRPEAIALSGWMWLPGLDKPIKTEVPVTNPFMAAITQHEIHHIEGDTALSYEPLLTNLYDPNILQQFLDQYPNSLHPYFIREILQFGVISPVNNQLSRVAFCSPTTNGALPIVVEVTPI